MSPGLTRRRITINDKVTIIELIDSHRMSQGEVSLHYNMSKSTISKIMKNKKKYVGVPDTEGTIRMRKLKFFDLEAPLARYMECLLFL